MSDPAPATPTTPQPLEPGGPAPTPAPFPEITPNTTPDEAPAPPATPDDGRPYD
jgi:hypothetical protein